MSTLPTLGCSSNGGLTSLDFLAINFLFLKSFPNFPNEVYRITFETPPSGTYIAERLLVQTVRAVLPNIPPDKIFVREYTIRLYITGQTSPAVYNVKMIYLPGEGWSPLIISGPTISYRKTF